MLVWRLPSFRTVVTCLSLWLRACSCRACCYCSMVGGATRGFIPLRNIIACHGNSNGGSILGIHLASKVLFFNLGVIFQPPILMRLNGIVVMSRSAVFIFPARREYFLAINVYFSPPSALIVPTRAENALIYIAIVFYHHQGCTNL